MLRTLAIVTLFLTGCDLFGPCSDPRIRVVVTVERSTREGEYGHVAMYNSLGDNLDARRSDAATSWVETLGYCDDVTQVSGQFKLVAWVNTSREFSQPEPAAADPQGADLVDVHCDSDECHATRDAHITIH